MPMKRCVVFYVIDLERPVQECEKILNSDANHIYSPGISLEYTVWLIDRSTEINWLCNDMEVEYDTKWYGES